MKKALQITGISAILTLFLGCGDESAKLYNTWNLTALSDSGKVVDIAKAEQPATLTIEKSKFNGNAGCNGFFGGYTLSGDLLKTTSVGSTRKLCAPESMAVEDTLMKLFADTSITFKIQGDTLVLEQDAIHAEFRAQVPANATQPLESKEAELSAESGQAQPSQTAQEQTPQEQAQ